MPMQDRIARLIRLEMQHPEWSIAEYARALRIGESTVSQWRKNDEYANQQGLAIADFNRESARVAAWKAAKSGSAETIIQDNQASAAQTIVMLMEDGTTEEIQMKASQDLLDRGNHPRGMKQTNEFSIDPETRKFLAEIVTQYEAMTGTFDVEARLRSFEPVLPGEPVPLLSGPSRV